MGNQKNWKRNKIKYPGLDRSVNAKVRWEFLDQDYIDKLSDEEKQYLSNFNEEFVGANFNHKGKKLHRSKKARKACYDRNNARNRDLYAKGRTSQLNGCPPNIGTNKLVNYLDNLRMKENPQTEDHVIDILDEKLKKDKKD